MDDLVSLGAFAAVYSQGITILALLAALVWSCFKAWRTFR